MVTDNLLLETLPNGLSIAVERMPAVQSASFTILVPIGVAHDPTGRCGLTAVLTEMMPRGAGDRDAHALTEALDSLGIERSVDYGAESLVIGGSLLARDLDAGLVIARDMLLSPRLDAEELPAARELCLQSITAIEDNPSEKLFVELAQRYFPQPYGRPTKGIAEELRAVSVEDLRATVGRFSASGAVVTVAGNVEPERVRDRIASIFADWPSQDGPTDIAQKPPLAGPSHILKEGGAQVQIGMIMPGIPMDHPDYPKQQILVTVLSGGMSGRLFVEVREKRGLVYSVSAWLRTSRGRGDMMVYAGATPDRAAECLMVLGTELDRLREGVGEAELTKARTQLRSAVVMSLESSHARADTMAAQLHRIGRVRTPDEVIAGIQAVDVKAMNAFLAGFSRDGAVTLTLGPVWPSGRGAPLSPAGPPAQAKASS